MASGTSWTSLASPFRRGPPRIFYTGKIGDHNAWELAESLRAADPRLATLNVTDAGQFLTQIRSQPDLVAHMASIADPQDILSFFDDPTTGAWTETSGRFAENVSGRIITIVPEIPIDDATQLPTGIFVNVELERLINNPAVTSIDGISREALQAHYSSLIGSGSTPTEAIHDIAAKLSDRSNANLAQYIEATPTAAPSGSWDIRVDSDYLTSAGVTGFDDIDTSPGTPRTPLGELLEPLSDARMDHMAETAGWVRNLRAAGQAAGTAGDLLEVFALAVTVHTLLAAGDREGAAEEVAGFFGGLAGGFLAFKAAATWASPLLAGGPKGLVAYGIVTLGAGFLGAFGGDKLVAEAFDDVTDIFYGRDGYSPYVDIAQRGPDGQLYVTRVREMDLFEGRLEFGQLGEDEDQASIVVTGYRDGTPDSWAVFIQGNGVESRLIIDEPTLATFEELLNLFIDAGLDLREGSTGGGRGSTLDLSFLPQETPALSVTQGPNGELTINGRAVRAIAVDPRNHAAIISLPTGEDLFGREMSADLYFDGTDLRPTGVVRVRDGGLEIRSEPGQPTTVTLVESGIGIDFADAGEVLLTTLGRYFIDGNPIVEIVTSAALRTLGTNFGEILNATLLGGQETIGANIEQAVQGMDVEFIANIKSAGIGALSSYLTAELVDFIGVEGIPGDALNSIAGSVLNQIIGNLGEIALGADIGIFDGVTNLSQIGNVAGTFLGNQLASEIGSWDEIGEQIGASIGGSLGGLAGPVLFQSIIPIPVIGAIIGSFLGNLLGGLIGGVFTGTPKSGAILEFDAASGLFVIDDVWKEDGGQAGAAEALGSAAADALNGVVTFIGGELVNGDEIDAGSYGMRGKRYVYWEDGTSSDNRVKFKEAEDLIEYGVLGALQDFQFLGGDVYAKRAFYNTMAAAGLIGTSAETGGDPELVPGQLYDSNPLTSVDFGLDTLLGNFAVVDRLRMYLTAAPVINALIAAEPDSAFSLDWVLALSRANELGLLKRNVHDWDGGFIYFLEKGDVRAADVYFRFETFDDGRNGERLIHYGGAFLDDTVDSGSKTVVEGSDEGELLVGEAPAGPDHIANVLHGEAGDDVILAAATGDDLFGGDGDDRLIGGALDDWMMGGSGDDVLDAGSGSGNVLSGGDGNDRLVGRGGSDWLIGDADDDRLEGGGEGDVLEGGTGADAIDGGAGSDTIVYRSGDGVDRVADTGTSVEESDRLELGFGIAPDEVTVIGRSSGESLSLFIGGTDSGDRIDLRGIAYGEASGIDEISFTNATWSRGDVTARAILSKTAGSAVTGTAAAETLDGTIHDDSLAGAAGNDRLAGGLGSDLYLFNPGDGVDTIAEAGFAADLDTLRFGAGIAATDVSVSYVAGSSRSLVVTVGAGGDQLILEDQLAPDGVNSIEQIEFSDGTVWTMRDVIARLPVPPSTGGPDVATGSDRRDVIATGDGNDSLTGALGDDSLAGGKGADAYHYRPGDGNDRIIDDGHQDVRTDTLVLGGGITSASLIIERDQADANNLRISFAGGGSILLDNQFIVTQFGFNLYDHGIDAIHSTAKRRGPGRP